MYTPARLAGCPVTGRRALAGRHSAARAGVRYTRITSAPDAPAGRFRARPSLVERLGCHLARMFVSNGPQRGSQARGQPARVGLLSRTSWQVGERARQPAAAERAAHSPVGLAGPRPVGCGSLASSATQLTGSCVGFGWLINLIPSIYLYLLRVEQTLSAITTTTTTAVAAAAVTATAAAAAAAAAGAAAAAPATTAAAPPTASASATTTATTTRPPLTPTATTTTTPTRQPTPRGSRAMFSFVACSPNSIASSGECNIAQAEESREARTLSSADGDGGGFESAHWLRLAGAAEGVPDTRSSLGRTQSR